MLLLKGIIGELLIEQPRRHEVFKSKGWEMGNLEQHSEEELAAGDDRT